MGILSWIGELFTPAVTAIDGLVTSDEERLELRNKLEQIKADVTIKMLEYDTKILELQGKLMETVAKQAEAEAKSESAFTRMYRPVIITCMFVLIALQAFGLLKVQLPDLFIQIFGTAFGVITLAPSIAKGSQAIYDKVTHKEK